MPCVALVPATRPVNATLTARFATASRTWWHRYRQQRRLRATVYALHALDDRTLKDIGLDRSEIESVVGTRCAGRRQSVDLCGVSPQG